MREIAVVDTGPRDDSLLRMQHLHVLENVWNDEADCVLRSRRAQCQQGKHKKQLEQQDELIVVPIEIRELLGQTGFLGVAKIPFFHV